MYSSKVKYEFEFVDPCLCNAWVATAVIGAGVLGAGATIFGASKAADAQTSAAQQAAATNQRAQDIALGMYNTTRSDLAPFRGYGTTAGDQLQTRLTDLTTPIDLPPNMTQDQLEKTPGYQFTLTQGLKGTQNSAAARGLATSGAALKGAATFATGLADKTYLDQFGVAQQQFQNKVTNQSNAYNRLKGLVDVGENASAQTGTAGTAAANTATTAAGQIGSAQTQAGTAQAAAANATGGALSGLANNLGGYAMAKGLYGNSSGGNTNMNLVTDA
jgi:hypothetical protein